MATTPNQKAVPSEDYVNMRFNAGKFDEFMTSTGPTYTDRLGQEHMTAEGIRASTDELRTDLASSDTGKGASLVDITQPFAGAEARSLRDKNKYYLDAADFGASPEISDNKDSLNNALDAVRLLGGGTLRINKPGTYKISGQVRVYANTRLEMCMGVVIQRNYTQSSAMINLVQGLASHVSIIGGSFDGNAHNMGDTAFDILGSTGNTDLLFQGVDFRNVCDFHCIDIAAWQRVVIRDCVFSGFKLVDSTRNFSEAIQLDPNILESGLATQSNDLLVENCIVQGNSSSSLGSFGALIGNHASSYGVQDNNIRIINCKMIGCLFAGVRVFNWSNWTVQGCTFMDIAARGVHVTPFPSSTKPQGSRYGKVLNNTFIRVRAPVLFAAPPYPYTDVSDIWHDFISISKNSIDMSEVIGYAFELRWCRNVTIDGNVGKSGLGFLNGNFLQKYVVRGNTWSDSVANSVLLVENTATLYIGTGLSGSGVICDNFFGNTGTNGIYVNCKLNSLVINGNLMLGVSTVTAGNSGVSIDSSATDILVNSNQILDNGSSNKPALGIKVSTGSVNVKVHNNTSYGTGAPVNNQATGDSGVIHLFSSGAPSTRGLAAPVGSLYTRSDGGAVTTFYVKESATNSSGWVAK